MSGQGRRLQITHRTGYRYADVVDASFNEVRMTPLSVDGQLLLSHLLDVRPMAVAQTYRDYWGAHVEAFDVQIPHRMLEVVAMSTVDTPPMAAPTPGTTWEAVRDLGIQDQLSEYLTATEFVDDVSDEDGRPQIVEQMLASATPAGAARRAVDAVRERITYTAGVTDVTTTSSQAWASMHGVCQDFTHATLSLLRGAGIPARYVSGYLHTEERLPGQTVTGESHAWVEYWDGVWQPIDPTNDRSVGSAHVIVARGRDYADVPPLKGIYAGGQSEGLGVSVEITQL